MLNAKGYFMDFYDLDAIEAFLESVTACSLMNESLECLMQSLSVHIEKEVKQ